MPLYDFECPHGHRFEKQVSISEMDNRIPCEGVVSQMDATVESESVTEVSCMLTAGRVFGSHSNPHAILQHNSAANRDAAREGKYDPLKPNTRFMAKGRSWRK